MQIVQLPLNGFHLDLSIWANDSTGWRRLDLQGEGGQYQTTSSDIRAKLSLKPKDDALAFSLSFEANRPTRLRLRAELHDQTDLFHLIPGNIFGDNNAAHVKPGQFPCLTTLRPDDPACATLWEFRADRASHPVSILCCRQGAVGMSIDPYSPCDERSEGFIRNGVFAALPGGFGVSLGYGNDPLTFSRKTKFFPATADMVHRASAQGLIFAVAGAGRSAAHSMIRNLYVSLRQRPIFKRSMDDALLALAESFAQVNWSEDLKQYTNRKCLVPTETRLEPWRAIVEIGWTGGSMMAYPFILAQRRYPQLKMPKTGQDLFDEICAGFSEQTGLIRDACINRSTRQIPEGWNTSDINGWWSGYLPNTRDAHCAYNNAHAAYYLLRTMSVLPDQTRESWTRTALAVLDTAISLQREDGAFGYLFSGVERRVLDYDGFAGCWFVPALVLAYQRTNRRDYLTAAERAMDYYAPFVESLSAWGSPMDTYKSVDSEGNLAFIRAARMLHEVTGHKRYATLLEAGANYEYLWRYSFRTRPSAPPLQNSSWNSCGGSITSVSNPHIHPMSVVATDDLEYLARISGDRYHQDRADDGMSWLMNTMELYPDTTGYGRYGVLSERTCPSDGLLSEHYADGTPSSTWWSYNAWAAASAMEALAEKLRAIP